MYVLYITAVNIQLYMYMRKFIHNMLLTNKLKQILTLKSWEEPGDEARDNHPSNSIPCMHSLQLHALRQDHMTYMYMHMNMLNQFTILIPDL